MYVAVFYPDSICYKNLASFGITKKNKNKTFMFAPNHAISAVNGNGMIMIPNAWMKFVYHVDDTQPTFEKLPFTQPNFTEEGVTDFKFMTVLPKCLYPI
jgi:hypothetical protein